MDLEGAGFEQTELEKRMKQTVIHNRESEEHVL